MRKKKYLSIFLLVALVTVVGLSASYYTDHKANSNVFTTGKVKISLTEEKFNLPENVKKREDLAPEEYFIKDPKITNVGKSDAYVFLEFGLPLRKGLMYDMTTGANIGIRTDRVCYPVKGERPEWVFVDGYNPSWNDPNAENVDYLVYAFSLDDGKTLKPLKNGQSTPTLYIDDLMQCNSFVEMEQTIQENIPVRAYAIQTTDIGREDSTTATDPVEVWKIVKGQKRAEGVK